MNTIAEQPENGHDAQAASLRHAPGASDDAATPSDDGHGADPDGSPGDGHVPVLVPQTLEVYVARIALATAAAQPLVMLDCTLGRGGHTSIIAPRLPQGSRCIGLDVDPDNLAYASRRMAAQCPGVKFDAINTNFVHAKQAIQALGVERVDLLMADIGFASNQMDDPERGFSFAADGPLDMRLDPRSPTTAADLVNSLPETDLANIIYEYGEERLSRKIARKIVEERQQKPILTTEELARVVRQAVAPASPRNRGQKQAYRTRKPIHPATRTFMALRIAVNDELEALDQLLAALPALMNKAGVAAIISFHSLEDRRVKQSFASLQQQGLARRVTKKPLIASDEEIRDNPRSRSAKLRAVEFE